WTTPLNFVDPETATAFHPANAELLHGLGMVIFGRELLSVVLNMGWLGLTLLAGWCVGRPFGRAPATLVATAVLLAPPLLVATQAGPAPNDIVAGVFLLACVVLVLTPDGRPGPTTAAGLAGGL